MSTWKPFVVPSLSFSPSLCVVNYVNKNKLEGLAQHHKKKAVGKGAGGERKG